MATETAEAGPIKVLEAEAGPIQVVEAPQVVEEAVEVLSRDVAVAPESPSVKDDDVMVVSEKEEVKDEVMTPGKRKPILLRGFKPVKMSKRPPTGKKHKKQPPTGKHGKNPKRPPTGKIHKLSKRPPAGKAGKIGKTGKIGKIGKIGKLSKRPPTGSHALVKHKREKNVEAIVKSDICLLSVKAMIVGHPEVKLPVWRPSIIPEGATVDKIVRLWAERTFGRTLRASEVPPDARCHAGGERGKLLDRSFSLKKIKNKLPLENGRMSIVIHWPMTESGMMVESTGSLALAKQSWAIKRAHGGEGFSLSKALALFKEEPVKKKRAFFCFLNAKDLCTDPDCPYPHVRS